MKWRCDNKVRPGGEVHVWPEPETKEHVLHGTDCECIPILTLYPEQGTKVVTHYSFAEPRELLK